VLLDCVTYRACSSIFFKDAVFPDTVYFGGASFSPMYMVTSLDASFALRFPSQSYNYFRYLSAILELLSEGCVLGPAKSRNPRNPPPISRNPHAKSEIQHRPRNLLQHSQKLIIEIHQRWTVNHVF